MPKSIYDCEDCDREDEFDDMVSCDDCSKWWHFVCAEVDERIKDRAFLCSLCKGKQLSIDDDVTQLRISLDKITVDCPNSEKPVEAKATTDGALPKAVEAKATTDGALPKAVEAKEITNGALNFDLPKTAVNDVVAQELKATFALSKVLPCKTLEQMDDLLLYVTENDSTFIDFVAYIKAFLVNEVPKSIKKMLDVVMHKDVQKQLSWSGLRTTLPSFEINYKPIVNAMNHALKEKFVGYTYDDLQRKLRTLLDLLFGAKKVQQANKNA